MSSVEALPDIAEGKPMRLLDFVSNVHSQFGEDGILAKILDTLPSLNRWCIEFGAWDGRHWSNTRNLIDNRQYRAVMIEGDEHRYNDLVANLPADGRVIAVRKFVGFTSEDGLDAILAEYSEVPQDFDVLSIDIDGNDYHTWKALDRYQPKVVCIEFNQSAPNDMEFVQQPDPRLNQGSSALSIVKLGKAKGYELVCVTHNNVIFVRRDFYPAFGIADNSLHALREDLSSVTYLIAGFDGTLCISGRDWLPQHSEIRISRRIRQIPRSFRVFPDILSPTARFSYSVYSRVARLLNRA